MSQDKIESRRAFMKKFGKLAGSVAVAVAFMTTTSKEAVAQPDADNPPTQCNGCGNSCTNSCTGGCLWGCYTTCSAQNAGG